jgi:hypothetical protein
MTGGVRSARESSHFPVVRRFLMSRKGWWNKLEQHLVDELSEAAQDRVREDFVYCLEDTCEIYRDPDRSEWVVVLAVHQEDGDLVPEDDEFGLDEADEDIEELSRN